MPDRAHRCSRRRLFGRAAGLCAFLAVAACAPAPVATPTPRARELTVFAASSLTEPFQEIGAAFGSAGHQVPGTPPSPRPGTGYPTQPAAGYPAGGVGRGAARVVFSFGATTALRTQLEQGARADVFASANRQQMELAIRAGLVVGEQPVVALNRLVVIVPKEHPGVGRLEDLARPGVKLVITQPDVPVGAYTREALRKMAADPRFGPAFEQSVLRNVRSEEANVKQLVAKVQLGEADAAWVYSTDLTDDVAVIEVPDQFNTVAEYPVAVLREAREPELAWAFVRYLQDEPGRAVLKRHGFVLPAV